MNTQMLTSLWDMFTQNPLTPSLAVASLCVLFLCVILFSILRTYFFYRSVMEISFEAVAKSAITGAWYNTFTIPFLGNFLGQSKAHAKHNIPASLVSLVVIGERVFMLFTGAMLFGFLLTLTHTNLNIINDYQKTFLVLLETIGFIGLCAILTRPWRFLPSNPFETFKIRWVLGALGITLAQWGAISMIFAPFQYSCFKFPSPQP